MAKLWDDLAKRLEEYDMQFDMLTVEDLIKLTGNTHALAQMDRGDMLSLVGTLGKSLATAYYHDENDYVF